MTAISVLDSTTRHYTDVDGTGNAVHTYETAAMGYDTSTGRTPVEQVNNYGEPTAGATQTTVIKAAPGFLHKLIISASCAATQIAIHDHASAASNLILTTGDISVATLPVVVEVNAMMTAGIVTVITGTVADGDVLVIYR